MRARDGGVVVADQAGQVRRHLREVAHHVVEERVLGREGRRHGLEVGDQAVDVARARGERGQHLVEVADDLAHLAVEGLDGRRHGGAAVDQLVDLGGVALRGRPRRSRRTRWPRVGLMDERSGSERVEERVDAGVGDVVVERDGGARRQDRSAVAGEELDLLLPDDVVPAHADVGGAPQRDRVVDAQGDQGVPVLHGDAGDLPDRDAGDVDGVAAGQTGDVAQLRVDGVPAAEQRDVADLHGQSRPAGPGRPARRRRT